IAMAGSHGLIATRSISLTTVALTVAAPSRIATIRNGSRAANGILAALRSVIFCESVPVYYVPPGFDVIGPAVLGFVVICVLPNIDAENWCVAIHERIVLVRRRDHFQFA